MQMKNTVIPYKIKENQTYNKMNVEKQKETSNIDKKWKTCQAFHFM